MAKKSPTKVAFIASYLPQKCGIATFTSDLIKSVQKTAGTNFEPLVVAMRSEDNCRYTEPVKLEIRSKVRNDYISAADYLNFSHVDLISIQHEFGLFGGNAGNYLNLFTRRIKAPIITTLHTVLEEPDSDYYQSTVNICDASHKVIVMNQRGVKMLTDIYGIDEDKIDLVPHGIPDLPFVDSSYYKHKFGMEGRRTILTFGLLSKNKGIENMLRALPEIIKVDPTVLYVILGRTHPSVIRHEGESYRFSLQHLVEMLGLQDNVMFHNQFVTDEKLHNFLCAADIYVTPYINREQLTSGTLAFAVGTGKAVVSTPYWAAEELLDGGRGKFVRFGDPMDLAKAIIDIIQNDSQFDSLRRKAYDYGRSITWPMIGKTYWKMFNPKKLSRDLSSRSTVTQDATPILEMPESSLVHLRRLTDDTGLYQHAKFTIPARQHGYCTDDNARALVAMTKYHCQYADLEALRLFDIYLSFVCHAQQADGTVRNFMDFDRRWVKNEPAHDALGRTLWALGAVMSDPPLPRYIPIIKDCFDTSVVNVPTLSLRGKAYAIFGMASYLNQFPGASDIKRYLAIAADHLIEQFHTNSKPEWQWFEDDLTYDNAVLVDALFTASRTIGNDEYKQIAQQTCDFLLANTFESNHFSFIGCKGWYKRGQKRARFDQQPIEAEGTCAMLKSAYDVTGDPEFLRLQRKAFNWFLGDNDLHIPVYDFRTKGCGDGLERSGVNLNQGAESMVSFLLGLLCIIESYGIAGGDPTQENSTAEEGSTPQSRIPLIISKQNSQLKRPDLKPIIES